MYCSNCGSKIESNKNLCHNCGINPLSEYNYCPYCGKESSKDVCVHCGKSVCRFCGEIGPTKDGVCKLCKEETNSQALLAYLFVIGLVVFVFLKLIFSFF